MLDEGADRAAATRGIADPVSARAHLRRGIRRRGREAGPRPARAGRPGRRPCRRPRRRGGSASREDLLVGGELARRLPAPPARIASCAARWVVAARRARREQPDLQAGPLRPARWRRRRGCGSPSTRSVGVHDDRAVGQDAVDVEQQQADARSALGHGHEVVGDPADRLPAPVRTSACATGRAGAGRPPTACAASTTMSDVILRCFHDLQRLDREQLAADGDRVRASSRRRRSAARTSDDRAHLASQVAVGDDPREPPRRRRPRRPCRAPCATSRR